MNNTLSNKITHLFITALFAVFSFTTVAQQQSEQSKVAIITGSSSGLGYELTLLAMEQNMQLVLVDKRPEVSKQLAKKYIKKGGRAIVINSDLAVAKQRANIIEKAVKTFGRVDYLFNNAGYSYLSSFNDMDIELARDLFEVNYWSVIDLTQQAVVQMKKQRSGSIINVSSILGVVPSNPQLASYAATKHALVGFFQAINSELKQSNISVKVVCPAGMKTNIINYATGNITDDMHKMVNSWEPPSIVAKEIFDNLDDGELFQFPSIAKQVRERYLKRLL